MIIWTLSNYYYPNVDNGSLTLCMICSLSVLYIYLLSFLYERKVRVGHPQIGSVRIDNTAQVLNIDHWVFLNVDLYRSLQVWLPIHQVPLTGSIFLHHYLTPSFINLDWKLFEIFCEQESSTFSGFKTSMAPVDGSQLFLSNTQSIRILFSIPHRVWGVWRHMLRSRSWQLHNAKLAREKEYCGPQLCVRIGFGSFCTNPRADEY